MAAAANGRRGPDRSAAGQGPAEGADLLGPDGLPFQVTKAVLERALAEEMTGHLGYEKHDPAGRGSGNSRRAPADRGVARRYQRTRLGSVAPGAAGAGRGQATLSAGYNLTGTIEFKLYYGGDWLTCSGTPVADETVTVTGNGTHATPNAYLPSLAAAYIWTATYSGDANNNPATTGCVGGANSFSVSPGK
jgi:hypothetical protein